jgi:hypothetical protein
MPYYNYKKTIERCVDLEIEFSIQMKWDYKVWRIRSHAFDIITSKWISFALQTFKHLSSQEEIFYFLPKFIRFLVQWDKID